MEKQQYSLPDIDWLLSFPKEEIMKYWLDHQLLDSPGLMMHIILSRMLVFQMAKVLPKEVDFDIDTALSLTTVYHATRQAADNGKAGKHSDSEVNEFMKNNWDMDYALREAIGHWLNEGIVQWIQHYRINPTTRNVYFPHESLEKNGQINWTETIPMLTSWLIPWAITKTSKRFQDLRDRRSGEIGKLELPYWKEKLNKWEKISLPRPIVNMALQDTEMAYKNENEIIVWIQDGTVTNEIMGKWILNWYEEWANRVFSEYERITGIDNFYTFLEKWIDMIENDDKIKKEAIKNAFEKMLWRNLTEDEFIPYIEGFDLLLKRIWWLKTEGTRELFRWKVRRNMENIERVIESISK